ncbi:MAG TPA: hypothetical protein PKG90_09030 [Chitinophagaceae bacterium]|nr:hypothetical protein [Chitinophagaceae bacterium]HNU13780.1 hypothetical protein [Chitinophagaceae bacterium]
MGKEAFFYASQKDIYNFTSSLEKENRYKYNLAGLRTLDETKPYNSLADFPNLGIADADNDIECKRILVYNADKEIIVREIPQSKGGIKYGIDQLKNKDTIIFSPGGELAGKDAIIQGSISTISDSGTGVEIFNVFLNCLKKDFKKKQGAYIGKNAKEKLDAGWRLTRGFRSPPEYDIEKY